MFWSGSYFLWKLNNYYFTVKVYFIMIETQYGCIPLKCIARFASTLSLIQTGNTLAAYTGNLGSTWRAAQKFLLEAKLCVSEHPLGPTSNSHIVTLRAGFPYIHECEIDVNKTARKCLQKPATMAIAPLGNGPYKDQTCTRSLHVTQLNWNISGV